MAPGADDLVEALLDAALEMIDGRWSGRAHEDDEPEEASPLRRDDPPDTWAIGDEADWRRFVEDAPADD